jgi:hypothetical protein
VNKSAEEPAKRRSCVIFAKPGNRKWGAIIAACFLLLLAFAIPYGFAQNHDWSGQNQLADNNLIVLLKAGEDVPGVKTKLLANFTLVQEMNINSKTPRTIFILQPKGGKSAPAAKAELERLKLPEVASIELNYLAHSVQCAPDDPEFSNQWALPVQHFAEALCLQPPVQNASITVIDTGITPIPVEMDASQIQQFRFYGGATGLPESPFDTGTHGTKVSSLAAATTNNATLMAGIANASLPVQVTMLRTSNNGLTHPTSDVIGALNWCYNNQDLRGGPGPISVSINADPPNTYNNSATMQFFAQALREQGDLYVNAAGNAGTEDTSPELYIRRVTGITQDLTRWVNSVYGPFVGSAPAVSVLAHDGSQVGYSSGTSYACPYWAGAIAYLSSIQPGLTATDADAIIESTATPAQDDSGLVIPNLEAAVQSLGGGAPHGGSRHGKRDSR